MDFVLWIFETTEIRFSSSSGDGTQGFEHARQTLPRLQFKENIGLNENSKATMFPFVLGKGEPRGWCVDKASDKASQCLSAGWAMIQVSYLLT